jgi:hypothetical protein
VPDLTDAQLEEQLAAIFNRPRKGPGARAACGTLSGYQRHCRDGENACDACRQANVDYKAAQNQRPITAPNKLKPITHGTMKGYKQHRYRREQACEACLKAVREDNAVRYMARKGGAR